MWGQIKQVAKYTQPLVTAPIRENTKKKKENSENTKKFSWTRLCWQLQRVKLIKRMTGTLYPPSKHEKGDGQKEQSIDPERDRRFSFSSPDRYGQMNWLALCVFV